jgi:hypothetical protein
MWNFIDTIIFTLALKPRPPLRQHPLRFDLHFDLNSSHVANLRPPCFCKVCRENSDKCRTMNIYFLHTGKKIVFHVYFQMKYYCTYNSIPVIYLIIIYEWKENDRTALIKLSRMRSICLTTPRSLLILDAVGNQKCQLSNVKIFQNWQKSC